mgnify:CR=1 FL=1
MFYHENKRKEYLDSLKKNGETIKNHQFRYQGNARHQAPVYRIRLDHLIFNQFNARIADELKTYQSVALGEDHPYDEALEEKIKDILWNQGGKNQETLDDIKEAGQTTPGVVTADGVIVSGNRRAMLLSRLKMEYFEGVILDEAYEGNKTLIVRLEASLQHNKVSEQDYSATAKQFSVYTMRKEHNLDWDEISSDMNESITKIKMYYEEMITMLEYLSLIGTPNVYTNLRITGTKGTKEEAFRETNKNYKKMLGSNASMQLEWPYTDDDADKYKEIMYDYIRAYNLGAPANFRKIGPGQGLKKGILSNEKLFKEFYEKHISITHPATHILKTLAEYAELPECENLEPREIAERRESDWIKDTDEALLKNYEDFVVRIDEVNKDNEPAEKLRKVFDILQSIDSIEELNLAPDMLLLKNHVSEISSIIKEIEHTIGIDTSR